MSGFRSACSKRFSAHSMECGKPREVFCRHARGARATLVRRARGRRVHVDRVATGLVANVRVVHVRAVRARPRWLPSSMGSRCDAGGRAHRPAFDAATRIRSRPGPSAVGIVLDRRAPSSRVTVARVQDAILSVIRSLTGRVEPLATFDLAAIFRAHASRARIEALSAVSSSEGTSGTTRRRMVGVGAVAERSNLPIPGTAYAGARTLSLTGRS